MAHLHNGKQGEIEPPIVTLYKSDNPTILMNGKLASGNITADMLEESIAGKQLANLTTAMKNGKTYVNVDTQQNPSGEIQGQLICLQILRHDVHKLIFNSIHIKTCIFILIFWVANLKLLFYIYNIMALIQDYNRLCFYILTVLMSTMIFALVLTLIFAPYNNYYIGSTNFLRLPLLDDLDRGIA